MGRVGRELSVVLHLWRVRGFLAASAAEVRSRHAAGFDNLDQDIERGQFVGQGLRESLERKLASAIERKQWQREDPGTRAHIDDRTRLLRAEMRQYCADRVHNAENVDSKLAHYLIAVRSFEQTESSEPGAIYEDIDS